MPVNHDAARGLLRGLAAGDRNGGPIQVPHTGLAALPELSMSLFAPLLVVVPPVVASAPWPQLPLPFLAISFVYSRVHVRTSSHEHTL